MTAALQLHEPKLLLPSFVPDHWVYLDWETFYDADYSLRRMTTCDYVRDPRFEAIGIAVDDGEERVWMEAAEFREWAKTVPWHKTAVVAHNFAFDGFILSHHYGIHPAFAVCTMSMARAFGIDGGVSLENLGEKFGIGAKGKEVLEAKGKRRKDFTQEEWLRYGSYSLNDVHLMRGIFDKMLEQGFPEEELWNVHVTMRMFTNPRLFIDEPLLRSYLAEEKLRKADLLKRVELDKSLVLSGDKFAHELMELGVDPPMKLSPKQKNEDGSPKAIYAFAKNDPGMQELLEHEEDEVRWLAEARIALKSTINETRTERFLRVGAGPSGLNTIPVQLNFYGAHTGRWSGAGRLNFQNLERTNKKNPAKGVLRKSLLSPFCHRFVAGDSSQIEARIVAWLAGHETLVQAFAERRDIYSETASMIYNRTVDRKLNPADELAGQVGKIVSLGLGFGLGWQKLSQTFLQGSMGPKVQFTEQDAEVIGVDVSKFESSDTKMKKLEGLITRLSKEALVVHCAVTDKIVQKWRKANEPIVEFWHTMEEVIEVMCGEEQFTFGPNDCLHTERHAIVLPNGMKLRYPGLKYQEEDSLGGYEGYSYLGQYGKQRVRLYGGSATENLVQALARVVVSQQMLHVLAVTGEEPCMGSHDEWSYLPSDAVAPRVEYVLREAMKTTPWWATGLPLSVEVGSAPNYGGIEKR